VLKAPGTKRLKLKYDELLSSFAFNFNSRRYNADMEFDLRFVFKTAPTLGRAVHVDPMNPKLKAPGYTRLKLKYD